MRWRRMQRAAVIGAMAVLMLGALYRSGAAGQTGTMLGTLRQLQPETIAMAVSLSVLGIVLSGVEWWKLIGQLGYRVAYRSALTAYLSAGLAGYVVNAVGPAIGSAIVLRRHGVSPGRAAVLTIIANALGFCGILVWAPIGILLLSRTGIDRTLPVIGRYGPLAAALVLLAAAAVMVLVLRALCSIAGSRHRLARRLLGSLPSDGDDQPVTLCSRTVLSLVSWSAGSWVAGVGALYVVLAALSPGVPITPGDVVGSAALAATLGSLAFFVPEGLGVSDGALIVLLTDATGLPTTTCIAAALAMRALDPITKLGLLGLLALSAHPAVARFLAHTIPSSWLRHRLLAGWAAAPIAPVPTQA
jgi:Lysylphosphatidylglycerol synthase TM region